MLSCPRVSIFNASRHHSPIFRDIQAHKAPQVLNLWRQLLQLIMVQPELLQRWQIAQVAGQVLDFIVAQIQPLQFGQSTDGFWQRLQQVLAQL